MTDWESWRANIEQVIRDKGQWLGLADENGVPMFQLPAPTSLSAPETRLSPSSLEVSMNVRGKYAPVHQVVDELVAEGLGVFDEEGRLLPASGPTRMVVVARDGARRGFLVSYSVTSGGQVAPSSLTIHGTDLLDMLSWWPCPSVPQTWRPGFQEWTSDAAGEYDVPRTYAPVEFATTADGYTMTGAAEPVIQTLIQDSLDAVNTMMGWGDPHMVVDMTASGRVSPQTLIRVQDASIWETVAEPAKLAGVGITVDLWWPGDDPVLARPARDQTPVLTTWDRPIAVVRVEQSGEA